MSTTAKADNLNDTMRSAVEALAAETDSVKQDAGFRAWLTSMSHFHHYSWGNQLLIAMQRAEATRVAGFNTWRKMGRNVKKGEKGIRILAPITRRRASEATTNESETNDTTSKGLRIAGWRGVAVFDVSQTDGKPLPDEPEHNATSGGDDLLPKLEAAAAAFNIAVIYADIPGRAEGYSLGGSVVIEASHSVAGKCGTLAHEIAHELMHKGTERGTKQQRELEAEATAYVVLAHFGMNSGSRFYLHGYGITGEMLTASMQVIAGAARRIIDQIGGVDTDREEAEEDSALLCAA